MEYQFEILFYAKQAVSLEQFPTNASILLQLQNDLLCLY